MKLCMPGALSATLPLLIWSLPTAAQSSSQGDSAAPEAVDRVASTAINQPNIAGIGIARIENSKVLWSGYWGEQSPGVPVTAETAFNTASVAKTIIAETVLRLADSGKMSLDDPIAEYYTHPDLGEDPRYALLTPRILLSHQAALKNWPWLYEDGQLAFTDDPGQGEFSYSGAGIEIVMRYLEARFESSYPQIANDVVLEPLGTEGLAVAREEWLEGRVSEPRGGDGTVFPPFTRSGDDALIEIGEYTAADNLYATVSGYASLLSAILKGTDLSPTMQKQRATLLSTSETSIGYQCFAEPDDCPDRMGYGVGWEIYGEPGRTVTIHGGNDFGEFAQVYFIPETGEGLVLFINGGNAFPQAIEIMLAVDPELRMAKHFDALIRKMREQEGG
ncbi:MAG: serine hydrolase domain-containing protein [Pseudomonadota bacterium]